MKIAFQRRHHHPTTRWTPALLLAVFLSGLSCSGSQKAAAPRTQRESDSIVGASQLPGASVVKKATALRDSAEARRAIEDTIGTSP